MNVYGKPFKVIAAYNKDKQATYDLILVINENWSHVYSIYISYVDNFFTLYENIVNHLRNTKSKVVIILLFYEIQTHE